MGQWCPSVPLYMMHLNDDDDDDDICKGVVQATYVQKVVYIQNY